jgi:hypothetical protein
VKNLEGNFFSLLRKKLNHFLEHSLDSNRPHKHWTRGGSSSCHFSNDTVINYCGLKLVVNKSLNDCMDLHFGNSSLLELCNVLEVVILFSI